MSGKNYKTYMTSIFEPLVEAAERPDLLPLLKTADLSPERRAAQFAKFKALELDRTNVVYLPNGGFSAIISEGGKKTIVISSAGMNSQDEKSLNEWALNAGLEASELDESTFLFLSHVLKGYYKLRDQYRVREDALNEIDIVGKDYFGHDFENLFKLFRPIFVFSAPEDIALRDANIFKISCDICLAVPSLRSQIIDHDFAESVSRLTKYPSIDSANIFQVLTAAHWRYAFLELFRILESIFYLPWVLDLKQISNVSVRAIDLKSFCRTSLQWRESQRPSIERIFDMLNSDLDLDTIERKIDCFRELRNASAFSRAQCGSRIYTIRNSLVHHEDRDDPTIYVAHDDQWRLISLYLALVLDRIHAVHERDLTPVANAQK